MSILSSQERLSVEHIVAEDPGSPRSEVGRVLLLIDEGKDRDIIAAILQSLLRTWPDAPETQRKHEQADFDRDLDAVLTKNAELYRRLAR
jgi:hypothetical protein